MTSCATAMATTRSNHMTAPSVVIVSEHSDYGAGPVELRPARNAIKRDLEFCQVALSILVPRAEHGRLRRAWNGSMTGYGLDTGQRRGRAGAQGAVRPLRLAGHLPAA